MNTLQWILASAVFCSAVMSGVWLLARKLNNYSIVDSAWALSFTALVAGYGAFSSGWLPRRLLIVCLAGLWSLRLGLFLARRIASHHPHEDARYLQLRVDYAGEVSKRFWFFFQYQAISVVALSIPFLLVAQNPQAQFSTIEFVAIAVWLLGISGEAIADAQKSRFRADPANHGKICDRGLWRYSRHPNYFFESLIWWGFFALAVGSPGGVWTLYCPLGMLYLLLRVTGVPLAEAQSLKARGDAFRAYQRRTSVFVPWFPRVLLVFLLLVSAESNFRSAEASDAPLVRRARIFELGHLDAAPLFLQETRYEKIEGGAERESTRIVDPSGALALTEVATYLGDRLISQEVVQYQIAKRYTAQVMGGEVQFHTFKKDEKGSWVPESNGKDSFTDDFISGPVTEAYLARRWNELRAGKELRVRFGVFETDGTVGFKFSMTHESEVGDRPAIRLRMEASSFFIRCLVSPIDIDLDRETHSFLRFRGRTPLRKNDHGRLKPLDAEILYEKGGSQ